MSIVQIKITLEDVEPVVTRTVLVPLDIRLDRLHLTIQAAMGWENDHLYKFTTGDSAPAKKAILLDVLEKTGVKTLKYIYDFGDSWEHRIKIGKISNPEPDELYPKLTDVAGRCPPEDVGGFSGYDHLIEALADPKHPDHEEITEWYGDEYDPNDVPIDELKLDVLKLAKRWKPRM